MGSLADLKAQILDEIGDGVSVRQIGAAIARAIEHHANERFWFNTESGTTATVANNSFAALPARLRSAERVYVTIGSYLCNLCRRTFADIEDESGDFVTTGQPTDYAIAASQARLYPRPNAVYTLTFTGVYDQPALTSDASSNAWTTEAADLIVSRAKYTLARDITKDAGVAGPAQSAESDALKRLRADTIRRTNTGVMKPSSY